MRTSTNKLTAVIENENARLRGDLLTLAKRFSHDLRTPLGGIISTTEAIKDVLVARDPSAVPLADSLLASTEEIAQLIKQVSFVARASANPLPKTSIHMADVVFSSRQRVEYSILKREAVVVEPPSWPVVPGVMAWLEMIWWHLLMNALRHGGQKCRIKLGWESRGAFIRFSVTDNGPGVAEVIRGKLFTEFHRLHEEPDVPGLGLSIVQRLVELQGGACGYEEAAQGGACFFFTLPVESGELRAKPEAVNKSA